MKSFKIFIAVACLGMAAMVTQAFTAIKKEKLTKAVTPGKGFAVIELFTSEGCSSCPSADALVARVEKEVTDKPVYILAYHVDYWNRLGWKDVFSSPEYSARQRQYADWLNLSSVYTPQIVVNGRKEFVGSEEGTLRNAIKSDLKIAEKDELALNNIKVDGDKATIHYTTGAVDNSVLIIALVQKNAATKVQRGENAGRTLSHVQIVTQLKTIALNNSKDGSDNISLPPGFDPKKWELIGFVQNKANGEITGAAKAEFPSVMSAQASN
ncbi:DUF1223 domain-containing protein [Pedobacter hartonius]|uniref:DUF1223 domain-containing protein n=1 Tax=Pedobacter hartonius TaxID=425514 RepID=A0A1H3VYU7_9SPHI|nr:DUF1223 domain-containing protein [Pedobacter hartonius]SDZ79920.1 hypothetical protein SAMN05443550_10118 [Pedobacter hartonius]